MAVTPNMIDFTWSVDPTWFHLGVLQVRYYSVCMILAFFGGYALLSWQVRRGGGDIEEAGDFLTYGVLGALVGARLGHVLFYDLEHALNDPVWVLKIWQGGMASHGAMIGVAAAMYLFTRRRGMSVVEGLDRLVWSAALAAVTGRIGNLFNSEMVGRPTNASWGVPFPLSDGADAPLRHPAQIYEIGLGLVVLVLLYYFDRKWGEEQRWRGAMLGLFLTAYCSGRFCVEFFKETDVVAIDALLTTGQWLSLPGIAIGVWCLRRSSRHQQPVGWCT